MRASAEQSEVKNPKTDMTQAEMQEVIRSDFEEFVNRKNLGTCEVNFAPGFVDHGADVPLGLPPGPAGAIQYVGAALKRVPDLRVTIEDLIAEDDKVAVAEQLPGAAAGSERGAEIVGTSVIGVATRL